MTSEDFPLLAKKVLKYSSIQTWQEMFTEEMKEDEYDI